MAKEKARPLAEIVREQFSGPFLLKAVAAGGRNPLPNAVKFIPCDEDKFVAEMNLGEDWVRIFPVAAFKPEIGKDYDCLCRRRKNATIVEAIPYGYEIMKDEDWAPDPFVTDFELVFISDEKGGWWSRHPDTGQAIIPNNGWEMPGPGPDGRIVVPTGEIELRPTCTRTYYIAGPVGTLAYVSHAALDVYEGGNGEPLKEFDCAHQFRIFGRWLTVFDIVPNPFAGLFEAEDFTLKEIKKEAENACDQLERWAAREMLPILHPDIIVSRNLNAAAQTTIHELANETWHNLRELVTWFQSWVEFAILDLQRRKLAGRPLTVKLPAEPEGAEGKRRSRGGLLINLGKADLEKMLFRKKPESKTKTVTSVVKKAAETVAKAVKITPLTPRPVKKLKTTKAKSADTGRTKPEPKPASAPRPEPKPKTRLVNSVHRLNTSVADALKAKGISPDDFADPFEGLNLKDGEAKKLDSVGIKTRQELEAYLNNGLTDLSAKCGLSKWRLSAISKKLKEASKTN